MGLLTFAPQKEEIHLPFGGVILPSLLVAQQPGEKQDTLTEGISPPKLAIRLE
jgi:hypothetical protein